MKKQWMYLLMAAGLSAGILSGCSAAGADGGSGTAKSSVAQDGSVAGGSASSKEADGPLLRSLLKILHDKLSPLRSSL